MPQLFCIRGWVKEVKIKLFLNLLLKLPWLLDGSVLNVFPSSFYCSILIRCIVFIGVECLLMIKQMEVGFCWALMLLWTFGMDFEYTCTV